MPDRAKYISDAELQQLRDHARANEHPTVWLLVDLATQTGLRVSELAAITVDDLDLPRKRMTVNRGMRRHRPARETLALSPSICEHLARMLVDLPRTFHGRQPNASIWQGQRGPWTKRGLQQAWGACCRRAGLSPRISIRAARHTKGVRMLRETGSLGTVQRQLGHSSLGTTYMLYGDEQPED
jgi:integrase